MINDKKIISYSSDAKGQNFNLRGVSCKVIQSKVHTTR